VCCGLRIAVTIFARVRWVYRNHPDWFYRVLGWLAVRVSELRMRARVVSLENMLRELRTPALLVHGECDIYLDVAHARALASINTKFVDLWVVPDANHNEAVGQVADQYRRRLTEVFSRHLNVPVAPA
jgi:pimeloyl-ACP methyl ester carboxylesterase